MVLHLIGLGLGDPSDITLRGLKLIQSSNHVYLENYTSLLVGTSTDELAKFYNIPCLTVADREFCESHGVDEMLGYAEKNSVCFLVVGDPFCATTHTDLVIRARERGIEVNIVHNASIVSAVGCCGLQVYKFGEIVSIPLWIGGWKPTSFYDKIRQNYSRGLHTLCLLDIKVKERNLVALARGKEGVFDPPRFMTVTEALAQLLAIENGEVEDGIPISSFITKDTMVVGLARVGKVDQVILAGKVGEISEHANQVEEKLGAPLHSLVICAENLHELENEYLKPFLFQPV